jgi:hypothetical protein
MARLIMWQLELADEIFRTHELARTKLYCGERAVIRIVYKHDTLEAVNKTRLLEDLDHWISEEDVR